MLNKKNGKEKSREINVGSIEEDINELKTLLFQDRLTNYGKRKMIDYYENEIARQKQINEEHQKINGELREKVKKLEEQVEYDKTHIFTPQTIKLNFIPKQMVIDKMKENKQILAKTNDGNLRERLYIENGIMKELLEGEK